MKHPSPNGTSVMASVKCPECGERVKVREDGKRLRCPDCGEKFFPPDEEDEERDERPRSRRKPAARSSASGTLIAALVGGGLLVLGVIGVAIVLIVRKGDTDSVAANPAKVTVENFKSVKPGMDLAEVEGLLGGSSSSSSDDMRNAFRNASGGLKGEIDAGFEVLFAQMGEGTTWRRWEGKSLRAWVAFAKTKDGQRAAYSTALEQTGGGYTRVEGFMTFGGLSDLDKLGADRKKEASLRDDPKWVRGAPAREALLGEWRDETATGYTFGPGGRLSEVSVFAILPGQQSPTYRVLDDRFLEIITPSPFAAMAGHPVPVFANTPPTAHRYEYLVNQDELALIDAAPNGATGARSYYRFPVRAGSAGEKNLVAPLLADLKGADLARRNMAYAKLRPLARGLAVALPALTECLRGPDEALMDYAVWIISDMKELAAPAVPDLAALVRGTNPKVALVAARTLGFIGPAAKDALPALRELVKTAKTIELRFEAEQSIQRIQTGKF